MLNENDNVPLSQLPVYYPSIQEDSAAGTVVLQIKATDRDKDLGQHLTYKIAAGNPEGFFAINASTGKCDTFIHTIFLRHYIKITSEWGLKRKQRVFVSETSAASQSKVSTLFRSCCGFGQKVGLSARRLSKYFPKLGHLF